MWNKRQDEPTHPVSMPAAVAPPASPPDRRESPAGIGPSIHIVGDVTGDEDITILGRVEGKVELPKNTVTVGQSGRVKADIRAKSVHVAGEVQGNLVATEQIVIRKTATMLGNLTAPRVGLEDGCSFRGSVEMETPAPRAKALATPAPAPGGSGGPSAVGVSRVEPVKAEPVART